MLLVMNFIIIVIVIGCIFNFGLFSKRRKRNEESEPILSSLAEKTYLNYLMAWNNSDLEALQKITSKKLFKKLSLELKVLRNQGRENKLNQIKIKNVFVDSQKFKNDFLLKNFDAIIFGELIDSIYEISSKCVLYQETRRVHDSASYVMEDGDFKLDNIIRGSKYSRKLYSRANIIDFADKNYFYYDLDFGRLMIPNKGELFSGSSFEKSEVNNHVIGEYKNKIVEFYSIVFSKSGREYFVGQAILPKSYNHILIVRKNTFSFLDVKTHNSPKIELESNDFNKEFNVYSDRADIITTFELLHPAYMEYIMGLPYAVSIEVVGNIVYFFSLSKELDYNKLLEIISRAFEEIKE